MYVMYVCIIMQMRTYDTSQNKVPVRIRRRLIVLSIM